MNQSQAPIGVYDSGVGGLTVWLALKKLVRQDLLYYGDTAHVPYGDKTKEQILFYSHNIVHFFHQRQVKIIVAACNTSSALALPTLRLSTKTPLFGVIEPGVEKAILTTKNNRVGLMATVGTINSGSYQKYFAQLAPQTKLFVQKCPRLVPLIEAGKITGSEVENALAEYLTPLLAQQVDTIILGCTHYPFLLPVIRNMVGSEMMVIDPAWQTAINVSQWLQKHHYSNQPQTNDQFWTSGNVEKFQHLAGQLIGREISPLWYHQSPEEAPAAMKSFLGELSPSWRGEDDE